MDDKNTTIQISKDTRKRLRILSAVEDGSYDNFLNKLLDKYENEKNNN